MQRVLQTMPEESIREKNVSFKTTPTILRLETKVKISGIFLGPVFLLLGTK